MAGGRYGPHFLKMAPKYFGRGPSRNFFVHFLWFLKFWCILQFRHFCTLSLSRLFLMCSVNTQHHRESFSNLILLTTLAIIHPVHTADCERAFSSQNVITTSLRNRINSDYCNEQMKIIIMGAPLTEFNFSVALAKWRAVEQKSYFPKVAMSY